MNALNKILICTAIFTTLAFVFTLTLLGWKIELLEEQLNTSAQAHALCEQKNNIYIREIALQNNAIEEQKLDLESAKKELITEKKKSESRWNAYLKSVSDNSCETIDELQKTFFKERE